MAKKSSPVYLPRSGVLACLKSGETLTDEEVADLDEYFLWLAQAKEQDPEKHLAWIDSLKDGDD